MTIDERPPLTRDPLQDLATASLEGLIDSTVALRSELLTHEAVCRRVLADVEDGNSIGYVLPAVDAERWRSALTDAIKAFEITRHHSRLVLVAMSLDEGCSIAEIARTWGVSRQLASRWVQEASRMRPTCDGDADGDGDDGARAQD